MAVGWVRTDGDGDGEDDGSLSEMEQLLFRPGGAGDMAALRSTAQRLAGRGALVAGVFCAAALACMLASACSHVAGRAAPAAALTAEGLRHTSVLESGLPDLPRTRQVLRGAAPGSAGANASAAEPEGLGDGLSCGGDEELYSELCYKKCGLITNGVYPVRGSPTSCCKAWPCTPFNSRLSFNICGGFNTAGESKGNGKGACPHPPGNHSEAAEDQPIRKTLLEVV